MPVQPRWLPRPEPTVEVSMMRAATLVVACAWPIWQIGTLLESFPDGGFTSHWYPPVTAALFIVSNLLLFAAWISGHRRHLVFALRTTGFSLVAALLLLVFMPYTGYDNGRPGLWFMGFAGVPAVAVAVTTSRSVAITFLVLTVGSASIINCMIGGQPSAGFLVASFAFAMLSVFFFVIFTTSATQGARMLDRAEKKVRTDILRTTELRARAAELVDFTALVHDRVLASLFSIAQGVTPKGPLGIELDAVFSTTSAVPVRHFAEKVEALISAAIPGATFTATETGSPPPIPGDVASMISLAVDEAAKNSAKHAGSDARRSCTVSITDTDIVITIADDGHGFNADAIRPTSAGVRLSIKARMSAVPGGSAAVETSPGHGTTVRICWTRHPGIDFTRSEGDVRDSSIPELSVYKMTGMNLVYSWQNGLFLFATFLVTCYARGSLISPGGFVTLAILAASIALIVSGRCFPLPTTHTAAVMLGLVLAYITGLWQIPDGSESWLSSWHLGAVAVLAALLAARGRPWCAIAVIAVGAVTVELIVSYTNAPDTHTQWLNVVSSSIIVIAAVLVNAVTRRFVRHLPAVQEELRSAESGIAAAKEKDERRREHYRLLHDQVGPVFAAAAVLPKITDALALRAHLMELQLRDLLRSPLLAVPALQHAVHDARARGVTVQLLDDHSRHFDIDDAAARTAVNRLLAVFLQVIDESIDDVVTIRLLPPGRRAFATVSRGTSLMRYTREGTPC